MQLQQLEKLKLLGEGTFGRCYLVRHRLTGQVSVLKQIEIMGMSPEQLEEAFKEANILKSLQHPFIVGFKDSFQSSDGHLNIVMNYADGGDLSQKIREYRQRGAMLGESQILDWFTQVCLAIHHVHRQKIIHRDIKAQNIFLTREGRVRLGDFGIARNLQKTLQKMKSIVGTPYYMSPEIIQNKEYTFKTDIWSLGVLLVEMCLLKPPFDALSIPALALKITKGESLPVPKVYSKELRKLASQIMHVEPSRRPTVEEILKNPLISHRVDEFLPREIRERELSNASSVDPKRIAASRGLLIDCGSDESGSLQEVVSPKNGGHHSKNHDLPVKRMDNYVKDSRGTDKNDKKASKRGDQLRRREASQPTLTPKGHAKIQNERKIMVKNSSMVSFEKKKPQNAGCFKKRAKCSPDMVQEGLLQIEVIKNDIKNDINSMIGQLSHRHKEPQIQELQEAQNEERPWSQSEINVTETPLQTLEQLIRELTGGANLEQMYGECEDGICMTGPCAGLVTLGLAMRGDVAT